MPSFYRVAKRFPPGDEEYLTARERGVRPRRASTEGERRALDALSAFDTEEGARQIGRRWPTHGSLIVRYDILDVGSGISWAPTFGPGHMSLWGDREEIKRYLVLDFLASV